MYIKDVTRWREGILFPSGEKMFYERAQPVSKILFLTRENNIHIFKLPCNVLFIIRSEFGASQQKLNKRQIKLSLQTRFRALHIFYIFTSEK